MAEEKAKEVLELSVPATFKNLIEALVFAAKEPLTFRQLKDIYEGEGPQSFLRQLEVEEVEASVNELNAEYEKSDKPYRIIRIAGGYQFATIPTYADWIGRLYKEQARRKLSQSGIESLAIIAYKQPVTKADIESVRGVNCDYVLKTLLEKELVTVVGRAHAPGRPLLYGTTREFLKHFGLNEITDLPRPREIEEILGESQFETERRMLEAQAGAEKMKEEEPEFKSRLPHIPKKKSELDTAVEIRPKGNQRGIRTVERPAGSTADENPPEQTERSVETPKDEPVIQNDIPAGTDEIRTASAVQDVSTDAGAEASIAHVPERSMDNEEPAYVERTHEPVPTEPEIEDPKTEAVESEKRVTHEDVGVAEVPQQDAQETFDVNPAIAANSPPAQSKTRWQTWKEKVQGFIKKIFG
ncbi:MAG TPA: SMC-Scp complex subunit ScpB [Bacteroidota bacterium]